MRRQTVTAHREDAESLAVEALAFIAADPERLARFLALTGIGPETIRAAARDSAFLASVLEHVCEDERLLLLFAQETGRQPADIAGARTVLRGPDWERDTA